MSLKGLTKGSRPSVDEFIQSAPNQLGTKVQAQAEVSKKEGDKPKGAKPSKNAWRPATLSLTEGWDGFLNELSCRTNRVRASRSDIVRIGLMLASRLDAKQLDELIKESRNIPDEDLLEGDFVASCEAIPELFRSK